MATRTVFVAHASRRAFGAPQHEEVTQPQSRLLAIAAPPDWTFNDYNANGYQIRLHLSQIGARKKSYPYGENRGLLFNGMLFHQTATCRFAEGFENRRRNITMLFRRRKG